MTKSAASEHTVSQSAPTPSKLAAEFVALITAELDLFNWQSDVLLVGLTAFEQEIHADIRKRCEGTGEDEEICEVGQ